MREGFIERHGLWTDADRKACAEILARIERGELDTVRFAFADQHGVLRGKTLTAQAVAGALRDGVNLTATLFAKDTSHKTVFPVFASRGAGAAGEMHGASDFVAIPITRQFHVLPWSPRTGWVQCAAYDKAGKPSLFDTRAHLQRACDELKALGFTYMAGLEVEFHAFRILDARLSLSDSGQPGQPPEVGLLTHGYQYLTEQRYDQVEPVMEILRKGLIALGLPLRSLEVEFGPSQLEITLGPQDGMACADSMILLRSAVKQICKREGYHATFMCRPMIPNVMSSGWHLHQSLCGSDGRNVFQPQEPDQPLSATGFQFLAGLVNHAQGAALLGSPTVNGYRRYRSNSLAPDRVAWAIDNRAAMLRILGAETDGAARIENRAGEPAANPYLYLASQAFAGTDGIKRRLSPPPSADSPYMSDAPPLPKTLETAIVALEQNEYLCEKFGRTFVDYYAHIKRAELERFQLEVTAWEQREYFDIF